MDPTTLLSSLRSTHHPSPPVPSHSCIHYYHFSTTPLSLFSEEVSAAAAARKKKKNQKPRCNPDQELISARMSSANSDSSGGNSAGRASRYESQKRRDWNTFRQYLRNHRPPLELARCSGAHVLEFLRYLDQFGKTKVHTAGCPFFGHPQPPAPCPCPLRQAWGSLDALVGRLRAAFEENGGQPEANPFAARAVRLYLREVRDSQSKARGIAYEKKKRKRPPPPQPPQQQTAAAASASAGQAVVYGVLRPDPGDFSLMNSSYSHHHHLPNGHMMMLTLDGAGGESSAAEAHPGGMIPLSVLH